MSAAKVSNTRMRATHEKGAVMIAAQMGAAIVGAAQLGAAQMTVA